MSDLSFVEVAVSPIDKFQEFLAIRKMRLTSERQFIVEEVFSGHEHFDAEDLVTRVSRRNDGRRVSRATVYRTLGYLEEAGLLRKVARANDREVWEHDYGYPQHDHLICSECGMLIEFHNEQISRLLEEISASHGFRTSSHRLEVHGRCAACSAPPKTRPRKLDLL